MVIPMKPHSVKLQRLAEKVFIVSSLLFYSGALTTHLPYENPIAPIIPFLPFVISAVSILLMIARWKIVVPIIIREKLLWVLMSIALASVFYSDVPMLTLYRFEDDFSISAMGVVPLLQVTVFGVYFGTRYSLNKQFQLVVFLFGIEALLSLVLGLALPKYGVMGAGSALSLQDRAHVGAWQGVYGDKNTLGIIMSLSALVFFLFTTISQKYRWVRWAGFSVSVGLILLSTSKTALVMLLTMLALLPLYRALRWNYTLAVPFFITVLSVGGGVVILFISNAEIFLAALGRDITFSGRTAIWDAVLDKIWERPWLGYGYHVFWRGWEGESADVWRATIHIGHAHNGFLDLGIDIGLLGLGVFALSFITGCLRAVAWIRLTKNAEALWPLEYLTFMILANITESSLMREDLLWLLYVAVTLSLHHRADKLPKLTPYWQPKRSDDKKTKGSCSQCSPIN